LRAEWITWHMSERPRFDGHEYRCEDSDKLDGERR
jgi:hypothetical protein